VVKEMGLLDTVVDPQTPTRTSARDMVFLLEALASGNLLSDTSSDELGDLLLLGKGTSALGAHIPDTIPIAAKWGHLDDLHHDVGIVYTDKTAYVVAILTQEFPDREAASEALACVSRIIYDYLTQGIGQGHSAASTSDSRLTGFVIPVPGAWLPSREDLLPNAPRYYRFGIHEGVDFYNGDACVPIYRGTPVVAAKDGVVIRADHDYTDITPVELEEMLQRVERQGYTDPESLDRFGGRQVKIDHGDGVETVYSHLLSIEDGIDVGVEVKAGQMIGRIGNSGTPESVFDPEQDNHLHFEIRVDGEYLGKGAPISEVRAMLLRAFAVQLQ
jgi:murein DD-endopeptidase MepM/ murein hydrolase activator NlpD